ncbi:MAG: hypothetical protein WCO78_02510 [Candidatus Roizmanbacteria bacterium]
MPNQTQNTPNTQNMQPNRHVWFILLCMTISIMTSGYVMALIRSVMLDTTKVAYQQYSAGRSATANEQQKRSIVARLSDMYVGIVKQSQTFFAKRENTLDKMTVIKDEGTLLTDMTVPTDRPKPTPTASSSASESAMISPGFNLTGPIDLSKDTAAKKIYDSYKNSGESPIHVSASANVTFDEFAKSEEYLRTKGTSYVNLEVISIFFDSSTPSKLGVEQAKTNAKKIMDAALERLRSGEVTMLSLGGELSKSPAVQEIDPGYMQNTYSAHDFLKPTDRFIGDPAIQTLAWTLPVGSYSNVLVGKSYIDQKMTDSYESFYTIIHVLDRQKKTFDSIDELLAK